MFANTLIADDKYSCRYMQNFLQQFQTALSQKPKTFSGFFIPEHHSVINVLTGSKHRWK